MLSLFPQLLDWSWHVPLVFRVFLGFYLFFVGYNLTNMHVAKKDEDDLAWMIFGGLVITLGAGFLLGVYVQVAGAIGFVLSLLAMYFKYRKFKSAEESIKYYLLVGIVALSLVFLGAGPYAFDLPL